MDHEERGELLVITAYIITAKDQQFTVGIMELPNVTAITVSIDGIPAAARLAAAEHTGFPPEQFTVVNDY